MSLESESGVDQDSTIDQEPKTFDEFFAVDRERDSEDIKRMMRFVKNGSYQRMSDQWNYESDKQRGLLKYSEEQIEAGEWEEDDLNIVIDRLRKDRIDNYFSNIALQYEQSGPIPDSLVRLDQENEIAADVRSGTPILIRGNWRLGKTSMVMSLAKHQFGEENSVFIDVMTHYAGNNESLEDFRNNFGKKDVAYFIAERELPGEEGKAAYNKKDEIVQQITESQLSPFEFLNNYLSQRGEQVFLSLDEVIGLAKQPEKMEYLAGLKELGQVQLAIVLHKFADYEATFASIFGDFKTHFMRPLTLDEVGTLVRQPLAGTAVTFTDEAIQRIFEFTGGRPMEVNNVCYALMHPHSEWKNFVLTYRADDIDALTVTETFELEDFFRSAMFNYKQIYSRAMSDEERAVINRLVEEGEIPISEIGVDAVQSLIDTTFVVKDDATGTYRINGGLFKRVINDLLKP